MEPIVQAFWLQKLGNPAEEYEDAYAYCLADRHFAIADGATESSFSDRWAQSLSRQFVTGPPSALPPSVGALGDWLRPLQQQWHAGIRWDSLPWFAEEKARQGAYAALLGLKFDRTDAVRRGAFSFVRSMLGLRTKKHPRWEGFAVGDCCVFQVRGEFLLRAFPVERSADFDNRPFLLGSNLSSNASIKEAIRHLEGEFQADDLFVLASDALAKWFLGRHEAGEKPWNRLTALASPGDFERFVAGLRTAAELRNDDTTLVLIRWAGKSSRTPPQRRLVATGLPEPE